MDLIIKKCSKCGAMVEVINDCNCDNCGIKCCNEQMEVVKPKTSNDKEKHLPKYEVVENQLIVTIEHEMNEKHHIEWIALASNNKIRRRNLNYKDTKLAFPYIKGSKIYCYCNTHGLFEETIE